jgi:hypothetical protein
MDDLPDRLELSFTDMVNRGIYYRPLCEEAAAEIRTLRAQLETAQADERAAVVAWLEQVFEVASVDGMIYRDELRPAIERGQHRETRDEG